MRCVLTTLIVCLGLLAWALQPAVSQSAALPDQVEDISSIGQSEAAERHARRTECLKEARAKKLVGAQKTASVKDCMIATAPRPSYSSTRSTDR